MNSYIAKTTMNIMTILGLAFAIIFCIYGVTSGLFLDSSSLQHLVSRAGSWGIILFILVQIIQVVIPVIPGGISCAAGVLMFGPVLGFVGNYVGIVIGSFINFALARTYGKPLVLSLAKQSTYDKYADWLNKGSKFDVFFALAIFFPFAPDDFLCMLAGMTKMSFRRFTLIILLGKPLSIAVYSWALIYAGGFLGQFLAA